MPIASPTVEPGMSSAGGWMPATAAFVHRAPHGEVRLDVPLEVVE
jgi:hypothetical protein